MSREPMDDYFAFFNQLRYDRDKARIAYINRYGAEDYRKTILPFYRDGCMSIFRTKPTRKTKFFVRVCADSVRARAKREEKQNVVSKSAR
jgi:hypothetical protein